MIDDLINAGLEIKTKPAGNSQKPRLFKRGKATSFEPIWYGIKKLAKNPNTKGTTTKKIIVSPWAVITYKYFKESPLNKLLPGYANSILIIVANAVPDNPLHVTKIK